jgi:hypothetical protein
LAALHEVTLPDSVPVKFGRRFMTRFYFPKLVADGLAAGDLYRFEGKWAGYNLYTKYPHTMLRDAVRRHFFFLCAFMPVCSRTRALRASKMLRTGRLPDCRATYWLTFGVHPTFRRAQVAGKRIANLLVGACSSTSARKASTPSRHHDRSNGPALILYRTMG